MAKRRVIIASSRKISLPPPVKEKNLIEEVEIVQKNSFEEVRKILTRETAHLIILGELDGNLGVDELVEKVTECAPRTPLVLMLPGEKQFPNGSFGNNFRGETLAEEAFPDSFHEIIERYLFSGYGAFFEYTVDELFEYCFPVITTLDYDPLCQTILDFFREVLCADAGFLVSEQAGRGSGFKLLAAAGFSSAAEVNRFLETAGSRILEKCDTVPSIEGIEDYFGGKIADWLDSDYRTVFSCRFEMEGMTPVYCVVFLKGRPIPEVASSQTIDFLYRQSTYALYNAEKSIKVQSLIYIDDLTKLYNARYLYVVLERELKRSDRYGVPVTILFLDVDFFKRVNDTYGHLVGSHVLCEFGTIIRSCVRETDTVVRYGGDEFVVILVETNPDQALLAAERMRKTVENHIFMQSEGLGLHLTVSIGIATYPIHASNKEELLQMADKAMYRGKDTTRNVVYIADV